MPGSNTDYSIKLSEEFFQLLENIFSDILI